MRLKSQLVVALLTASMAIVFIPAGCPGTTATNSGGGYAPTSITLTGNDVEVAARIESDWIFVEVSVNGVGPYMFILDTGAASAAVSPRVASLFPQSISGSTTVNAGAGTTAVAGQILRVDTLSMGGVRFEGFQAVVVDLDQTFRNLSFTVDGVVGLPLFGSVALTLDYTNSTVRVQNGILPAADGCTIFPIQTTSEGLISMAVNVAGTTTTATIDSGGNLFMHLPSSYNNLTYIDTPNTVTLSSVTGPQTATLGCLAAGSVNFGCISYENPCVVVGGEKTTIGGLALMPYRVTIDQTSGLIRFQN